MFCNVVCPAIHIEAARDISKDHAQNVMKLSDWESVLPTPLSPTGENPPTHWLCSTDADALGEIAIAGMIERIASETHLWCAADELEMSEENLSSILTHFCVVLSDSKEAFLSFAGLSEVA